MDAYIQLALAPRGRGLNLYQFSISDLMKGILPLVGEQGIKSFVIQVGI